MTGKYDFGRIEKKWQAFWREHRVYEPDLRANELTNKRARKPFYNLMMFPYPSAEGLHVGNMYAFTGSDIYGRFKRMQGYDVFEPMGLDGFGIHSENYALKIGAHPATQAKKSQANFYRQLGSIGNGFAWDERIETYDPAYYRWTQWIFTEMFRRGLAYRKKQPVNWCPSCKTVLADEQAANGRCERCGTTVVKKDLEQWFFKITDYAERLLKNLETLDWSERVKIAQRNWIGKSEGAEIDFEIAGNTAPAYVLLHGYNASPKNDFRPWLKHELEKRGAKVYVPPLPHARNPRVAEQVEFVLKHVRFTKNTVLLGHSLGSIVALKVLEKLKQPVRRTVLVAGFTENRFLDHDRFDKDTFDWRFDAKRIRGNAGDLRILHDTTDAIIPPDQGRKLQQLFGGTLHEFAAQKMHVCGKEEPEVLCSCIDGIRVFTTRPDTLFGATYMVLSPEYPLIQNLESRIKNYGEVKRYVSKAKGKSEEERIVEGKEKTGIELKGIRAINPATKEKIPVWVADYVLGSYGTGAIMAVPAHDERDFEFAAKYKLPMRQVVAPYFTTTEGQDAVRGDKPTVRRKTVYAFVKHPKKNAYLCLDWEKFGWHSGIIGGVEDGEDLATAATREIQEETGYRHIRFVKQLTGEVHNHFYAGHKNVNRYAVGYGLLFELVDEERGAIEPEHTKNHAPVWIDGEKMGTWLNLPMPRYMWEVLASGRECFVGDGVAVNSGKFDGIGSETAKWAIAKAVGGTRKVQYRLRDWLISRQRYWGPPIPMVFCGVCAAAGKGERKEMPGWYAVPEKDLPVKLPFMKDFQPKGKGQAPLATVKSFYETKCPKCGGKARRETDVSDTFLDSAWYYLGYLIVGSQRSKVSAKGGDLPVRQAGASDGKGQKFAFDQQLVKRWLPVDRYIGGAEHSVLHLLYARFFAMAFHDARLLDFEEPFTTFRAHGLLVKEGAKMSKSKGNVINPDEYIAKFGADALRMYLMFLAPFEQGGDFRDSGVLGATRFLDRVRRYVQAWSKNVDKTPESSAGPDIKQSQIEKSLNRAIAKVTGDVEDLHFNTAVSALMIFLNEIYVGVDVGKGEELVGFNMTKTQLERFLKLLAPFSPHLAEELWHEELGRKTSIHRETWPTYNKALLKEDTFTLVIQVNGRVRDSLEVPATITEGQATALALGGPKVQAFLKGSKPRRVIYVPKRLVNIVI